jgi:hypothetical protein
VDEEFVYWLAIYWDTASSLFRINDKETQPDVLLHDQSQDITSFVIASSSIYFTTCSWDDKPTGGIYQLSPDNQSSDLILKTDTCPRYLFVDSLFLYFIESGIKSINLENGNIRIILNGEEMPELLKTLHIGMRDEYSYAQINQIVSTDSDEIYFTLYVDNYPGMISCTDQAEYLVKITGDSPIVLHEIIGQLSDIAFNNKYFYMTGSCEPYKLDIINIEGQVSPVTIMDANWTLYPTVIALDESSFYWWENTSNTIYKINLDSLKKLD